MSEMRGLLVGSHFTPPAKAIISALARGARVRLVPEPENPYDSHAIRVLWYPERQPDTGTLDLPEATIDALTATLPDFGEDIRDVEMAADEGIGYVIGHVSKSGGKPLRDRESKGEGLSGNSEMLSAIIEWPHEATLDFAGDGSALIVVQV